MQLEIIDDIDQLEFVNQFVAQNKPVVIRGVPFEPDRFSPLAFKETLGDLTTQIYGSLFDLENISTLAEYIDEWFGKNNAIGTDVPYVRWYNQLKDIDFVWGDEAFTRIRDAWHKPHCIPDRNLIVPSGAATNPVRDPFPYRAIQVAARGARTRLHRDPFCSDAVVSQFYGVKQAILYSPSRADELAANQENTSFGGFIDVRQADPNKLSVEPDFQGELHAGDMIYVPHGWLHDVMVVQDSISVTWNFVHARGANEFQNYLNAQPEQDSEYEILQYFLKLGGTPSETSREIVDYLAAHID